MSYEVKVSGVTYEVDAYNWTDVVVYNDFHVPLDSPLAARLRKQDEGFAEGERLGTLEKVGDESEDGSTDYSKLKVDGEGGLDALLKERNIEVPEGSKKADKVKLLEDADNAAPEGSTLS